MKVTCLTCEQDFISQWHYDKHANRAEPCVPPRAKIDGIIEENEELNQEVDDLQENVGVLEDNVEELEGNVEELEGNVEELEGNVEELEGNVEVLEDNVDVLEGNVEELEVQLVEEEKDDAKLERRCEDLTIQLQLAKSTVRALEMEVDTLRYANANLLDELSMIKRDFTIGYSYGPCYPSIMF
jgi:chromosome segregation ATPase